MKKKWIAALMCLLFLSGCGFGAGTNTNETETLIPETRTVRMALNPSGNILTMIAEEQGYLKDEGITVVYVPVSTDAMAFKGIQNGTIDVAANCGTNLPLQYISEGMDLTIFGGYLLTGCMPVFARADTEWNGIEDLIGKTMACEPNLYAITGPLLDKGYDPLRDITWYNPEDQADRIKAVENGDADFGLVGTAWNYDVITNPNLKIVTYAADVLPEYSCCRAEALTSWVQENPNTVTALLKAWIRAKEYYNTHPEETIALATRKLGQNEEYVRAYLGNPRFEMDTDPMKKSVLRAWNYMDRLGLLSEEAKQININDHINVDLYKKALDACQAQYGSENQRFYEKLQTRYALNNY